jgi:hypothetical protein
MSWPHSRDALYDFAAARATTNDRTVDLDASVHPQDGVDLLVTRWIILVVESGAGGEQLSYDVVLTGPRLVDRRPDRRVECIAAVDTSRAERCVLPEKQSDCTELSAIGRPVQCIQSRAGSARWIDATTQQVLCYHGVTKEARARQRLGERVRLIGESTLLMPFDDARRRAAIRCGDEQRFETREVALQQPLNGVTEIIVRARIRLHRTPSGNPSVRDTRDRHNVQRRCSVAPLSMSGNG